MKNIAPKIFRAFTFGTIFYCSEGNVLGAFNLKGATQ